MSKIGLLESCNIVTGKLDANAANPNGIYPFFTCGSTPERIDEFAYDCDAVLLAGNNAQGNFHIQRYKGQFNAYQRTYIITAKDGYDIDYIRYSIEMALSHLKKIAQGSQTKFLTMSILEDFLIDDIPLEAQKKTIAVIREIDKKIRLNETVNDNLQHQLQTLYDYWFTQFDFPDENGRPYRLSGGAMEYNKAMKRLIPSEWKVESVVDNSITSVIKPGVKPFNTKTYLATADVNGTSISTGNQIEYETREGRANMQPTTYSVWFAKMKNSVKHLYLNPAMSPVIENTILSTGFCGLQCDEVAFEYIASYIEHSYFETMKNILAHGATQEAVNNDDMTSIPLAIPSLDVLQRYHESTRHLYAQISNNICENYQLAQLRDWLLPMLMNGQATISD